MKKLKLLSLATLSLGILGCTGCSQDSYKFSGTLDGSVVMELRLYSANGADELFVINKNYSGTSSNVYYHSANYEGNNHYIKLELFRDQKLEDTFEAFGSWSMSFRERI